MGDAPQTPPETVDTTAVATQTPTPTGSGLFRPGAQGGYVDVDRDEARRLLQLPPDPDSLAPEIAKDFVAMLGAVETVVNDGIVKDRQQNVLFKYPTAGAIVTAARVAMHCHNFAALWPGGYRWHKAEMAVTLRLSLLHTTTGQIIPMGQSTMPVDGNNNKAVTAAVTELRKYMLGLALNMSWNDSTEDAVQRQERQRGAEPPQPDANPPRTAERRTYPAQNGAPSATSALPHSGWMKPQYTDLLDSTRESLKTMHAWGFTTNTAMRLATGRIDNLSKTPLPSICDTIVTTATLLEKWEEKPKAGLTHDKILSLAAEAHNPLAYERGKITEWGTALDRKFMSAKPAAAEPDDTRQPPAAWQNEGKTDEPKPSENGRAPVQGPIDPDDIPF